MNGVFILLVFLVGAGLSTVSYQLSMEKKFREGWLAASLGEGLVVALSIYIR